MTKTTSSTREKSVFHEYGKANPEKINIESLIYDNEAALELAKNESSIPALELSKVSLTILNDQINQY